MSNEQKNKNDEQNKEEKKLLHVNDDVDEVMIMSQTVGKRSGILLMISHLYMSWAKRLMDT